MEAHRDRFAPVLSGFIGRRQPLANVTVLEMRIEHTHYLRRHKRIAGFKETVRVAHAAHAVDPIQKQFYFLHGSLFANLHALEIPLFIKDEIHTTNQLFFILIF